MKRNGKGPLYSKSSLLRNQGRDIVSYAEIESDTLPEEDGLKISSQTYIDQETVSGKTTNSMFFASKETLVNTDKRKSAFERLGDKQKNIKESTSLGDSLNEISCVKDDGKTNSNELTSKKINYSQSRKKSTSKQLSDLHQRENYKKASSRISNAYSRQIDENKTKNQYLKSQRDRQDSSNNTRHTKRSSYIKSDHSDHQHDNYPRNNNLADIQVGGSNERGRSPFKIRDKCSPHDRGRSRIKERDGWSPHDRGKSRFNIRNNKAIPDKRKQKSSIERHRSNLYEKRSRSKDKWRPCSNKRQNLCPNNSSQSDATKQSRQGKGPRSLQRKRLHSLDRQISQSKRSKPERSAESYAHCSGSAESSRYRHWSVSAENQMTHSESVGEMAAYGDIQHLDGNAQPKQFNYYGDTRLTKEQSSSSSHKLTYENRTTDRIALEETTRQNYQYDDPYCAILQDYQNHTQLNRFTYDYNEHRSKRKQRSNENERNQCDRNENVPEDFLGDYVSIIYSRETHNNVHKFSRMLPGQSNRHVQSYSNNSNFNMWQQNAKELQNVSSYNKYVNDKRQRRCNIQNGLDRSITKINLNILSEMNADDLAVYLSINHEDLDTFVWKTSNVENIDIFIQILGRVCESTFTVLVEKALYPIKERKFFERVDVKNMICELRRTKPESFDVDKFNILRNMLVLMNTLTEHLGCGPTELLNSLDSLQLCTTALKEEEWETEASELIDNIRQKWDNPRFHFTHKESNLSILPSLGEIETFQHSDVDNNYDDEAEYLERLFLVHRQDFVRPLCQGLVCLRNDLHRDRNCLDKKWRNDNIRVYKDVQLLTKCCSQQNGVTWRIGFDVTAYRKINWTSRKLLSYGSLVCLTDTTFSFIYFATVAERKPEDLTNGVLEIKFINNQIVDMRINYNLILVESQAFFPSYYHTLESLRTMHSQILNNKCRLPFGEHIVSSCVIAGKPKYFDSDVFKEDGLDVRCFDPCLESIKKSDDLELLPASSFGMDESQYSAFVNAITSKLSIIQGPPGTGKTVVGLKLAELLLQNTKIWRQDENKGPMLLLSYTNHALDQFLLEISKRIPTLGQQDIVRIGSRSELEALQKYNLIVHRSNRFTYNVVEMSTKNGSTRTKTNEEVANICKEVAFNAKNKLKDRIEEHEQLRTLRNKLLTGIVHRDWFFRIASVMIPRHYDALNEAGFIFWLCLPNLIGRSLSRKNQLNSENMYREEDFEDFDIQRSPRDNFYDELEDNFFPNNNDCLDNNHWIPNLHLDFYKLKMMVSSEIIFSPVCSNFCKTYSDDKKRALLRAIEKKIASTINMPEEEVISVYDIWHLNYEDRWRLYKYWLQKALTPIEHKITKCEESFERANTRYKAVQQIADMNILQNAKLIACTTTRAARDIEILKRVAPTIIILEEAAEIPEHHVISCLTSSCQQLIMIGDQQQLRPSYNDYQTAREHKINISLFERLI